MWPRGGANKGQGASVGTGVVGDKETKHVMGAIEMVAVTREEL